MKKFSQLLSRSWQTVFRDQKTFWTLFLLSNGTGIILMIIFYTLWYSTLDWINSGLVAREEYVEYMIFMVCTFLIWGFFGFIGMLYLANIFSVKNVKLEYVFSQWKNIFPYIWTIICVILYYIAIWATVALIFALTFWIGYLWYISMGWVSPEIAMIIYVFGWVIAFLILAATIITAIWFSISMNTFSTPAFFLDNYRYFQAPLNSKRMITGRWWRTVWNIILASIVTMIVPLFLALSEAYMHISSIFFSVVTSAINWVAAMVLVAFLFSLYISYREESLPASPLPKKVKIIK